MYLSADNETCSQVINEKLADETKNKLYHVVEQIYSEGYIDGQRTAKAREDAGDEKKHAGGYFSESEIKKIRLEAYHDGLKAASIHARRIANDAVADEKARENRCYLAKKAEIEDGFRQQYENGFKDGVRYARASHKASIGTIFLAAL